MEEEIEMETRRRNEDPASTSEITETALDFPDVPITEGSSIEQQQLELRKAAFVNSIRNRLKLTKPVNHDVYKHITTDAEGYMYYKHKRLTSRKSLLSIRTLMRSPESREFLEHIGYSNGGQETVAPEQGYSEREQETVAPEQALAIKSKLDSFKATEESARKEKENLTRQLEQASDENEKKRLQDLIQQYDQMEIQARRRYNEIYSNQFKRMNEIILDDTKPLLERIRELFRRDGLTIGALITAIGLTISTLVMALSPSPTASSPHKKTFADRVKQALVKVANWFLDLAKKTLAALPGAIGGLISFLLKKAGEAVLFLSEHLFVLLTALLVFVIEIFWKKLKVR